MSIPPAHPFRRSSRNEWTGFACALLILGGSLAYWYVTEHRRVARMESERLAALSTMLVKDVSVHLIAVNNALNGVIRDRLPDNIVADPAEVTRRLRALVEAMPGVRGIVVLGDAGRIVAAVPTDLVGRDFSQRAYFTAPRRGRDPDMLYVSPPFRSIRGDVIMNASRLVGSGGSFRGVVSATLDPAYFAGVLRAGLYAPDLRATLGDQGGAAFVVAGAALAPGTDQIGVTASVGTLPLRTDRGIALALVRSLSAVQAPLHTQATAFLAVYATFGLIGAASLAWYQGRRRRFEEIEHERARELVQADALSASEARFRTLIEEAPVAVAMARQGHFIYTNRRYNILHGYEAREDLTGLPWQAMIAPDSVAALPEQAYNLRIDAPVEQRFEAVGLGKGETRIPVFKSTTLVELGDGPATLIFVQDISAQKTAERSLLEARDAAQAANRSKAEFLANMSHEIRTPLNAILGLAYLLERGNQDSRTSTTLGKIRNAGRSLLGIINDILDVSKIEAGAMVLENTWFSLQDVIDTIANAMGVAVADKQISLLVRPLPDAVGSVMGDALRLEQLLSNLTSNAIKFTERGRVELAVRVRHLPDGRSDLLFQVSDTGIGVAPEKLASIFSPFTQADNSTTRRFGGSGLGLTICKQIIDLMGGHIGVDSAPGIGSVFWFALPLPMRAAAENYSSPDMVDVELLVAVAGQSAQSVIQDTARTFGWQTHCFDGDGALLTQIAQRSNDQPPGVVVLDWEADDGSSVATARTIRASMPIDACPVILLISAYRAAALEDNADRELIDAVLVKPVTASTLYNAVIESRRKRLRPGARLTTSVAKHSSRASLSGLRILVVDDSEINRDVAEQILASEGALVELAANGREAVDRLLMQPGTTDLILMDVQMPVMDGIEATRILRSMPQFADLPIIALTAGAFIAQQEAARSAGMTDFVAKPFDVPATVELIRRLTGARGGPEVLVMERPGATPGAAGPIDMALGERIWGSSAQHRRYIAKFFDAFRHEAAAIRAALDIGNTAAAAAVAHKLAGAAANVALPQVRRAGLALELALREHQDYADSIDALEAAIEQALAAVAAAPDGGTQGITQQSPLGAHPDAARLVKAMHSALLEGRPLPAEKALAELVEHVPVELLLPIRTSIDNFDFPDAIILVRALAAQLQLTSEQ